MADFSPSPGGVRPVGGLANQRRHVSSATDFEDSFFQVEDHGIEPELQFGVASTNNHAERALRFAVLWRKRSRGMARAWGDDWGERILSLRRTRRIQGR